MNKLSKPQIKQLLNNARDWIEVRLKSLIGEKKSLLAIWKLFYTTIGCISSIYGFTVLLKDLAGNDKAEEFCKNHLVLLIIIAIVSSLIIHHQKISCKGSLLGDDLQIVVTVKDLFCSKASSYVIPTNTFFRTNMDGEYISPQSVQGAFQIRYFDKEYSELDNLIRANLDLQDAKGDKCADKFGPVIKYPIGTVSIVDHKDKHYYFVAISDVNQFGKPENQTYENVEIAMNGLFKTINEKGYCDDLAMPLIGSGRAAIREATIEKVVFETIDRFLTNEKKTARRLTICIKPKDFLEGRVDLKRIEKYLDYKSEFKQ